MLKDQINKGQNTWRELHAQSRFRPLYPSDAVVRWALGTLKANDNTEQSVLDVGCGAGRHAMFFARLGLKTHAVDFSSSGIEATVKWAEAEGLKINAKVASAFDLPFADESMDAVLCYGVLYYLDYENFKKAVAEIRRVLKPGGHCLVLTRTEEDSRIKGAEQIDPHTYILSDNLEVYGAEAGMVHCFLDADSAREVFKDFSSMQLDRMTVTDRNGAFTHDDWLIQAIR